MNPIVREARRAVAHVMLPVEWLTAEGRYRAARARGADQQALERHRQAVGKTRATLFGYGDPLCKDVAQLYKDFASTFEHQYEPPALGQPSGLYPHDVIVVDNFYEDPDAVREYALGLEYVPYARHKGQPFWFSSALEVKDNPLKGRGVRLAHEQIKRRMSEIVGSPVDDETWETSGDGWNGAFHYKVRGVHPGATSQIHNHTGRGEDVTEGWSGLVYLSKNFKDASGTSIWRHKETGLCYSNESVYTLNHDDYELMINVENRYNRLVLFYASVFHLGEEGFGTSIENARMFQTFFFNVRARDAAPTG